MKTAIYNKVKRAAMLIMAGAMASTSMQAQEALHLFYKDGTHDKIAITNNTEIEFVKHPYVEVTYNSMEDNTIHVWANAGRAISSGRVKSNVPWTVSTDVNWLKVRHDKLEKYKTEAGEGMKETVFRIFTEANKTGKERTATVTITPKRGEAKTFTVVQHPAILSLEPIGETYGFEAVTTKEETIAWNETEYYADAYPNFDVKVLSKPNWMTLDSTVNNENFTLEKVDKVPDDVQVTWEENLGYYATYACLSFEKNRSAKSRTGNIIFELNGETVVFTVTQEGLTDATTLASLEDIQQWMVQYGTTSTSHDDFSHMSVMHATDMMSEDMTMFNSSWFNYDYEHDNNAANYRRNNVNWQTYYGIVTRANAAIDLALDAQNEVSNENFVLGNAYAYRAMAYLYLIQLFQDPTDQKGINASRPGVPMLYAEAEKAQMSTEQIEYFKGRNTVGEVFAQIEADITHAIELLQGEVRPTKNYIDITVAQGIAARYYLLAQEWEKAATMANAARNGYRLMDGNTESNGIRDGFMDINNEEWMWGFDHTEETQTTYASFFSHISNLSPGYSGIGYTGRGVDARLFSQMSATDYRRAYWYNDANGQTQSTATASPEAYTYQYPYAFLKFGWKEDWTQDYIYMRAAEMVLIEAEAWAHLDNVGEATNAYSELMAHRDPNWTMQEVTLEDIYLQRRLELIGEGHAYFDLKRLNKGINRNYEGNNHLEGYQLYIGANDPAWVYKIPQSAINNDYTFNLTEEDNILPKDSTLNIEITINDSKVFAEEIRPTSASFNVNTSNIESVTYLVKKGYMDEWSIDITEVLTAAEVENRVVAVTDGNNTINVYSLEGNTAYTIFFAYEKDGKWAISSERFTTPAYNRIITVVESKKDGFKFHFEVPVDMVYMYAFTTTEWYNGARSYGWYDDVDYLLDGKLLKGPQTIEINNGDYWIEDDGNYWNIHPGSAYTVLMAECDANGNLLYKENPNYDKDDDWGDWSAKASAARIGTAKAPRVGNYTEEPWYTDEFYPTGLYARQNLYAALDMVDSRIKVELTGKTERSIKVRCSAEEDVRYVVAPIEEAEYNEFANLVTEEAVATSILAYYGDELYNGTKDFKFDENFIEIEVGSTYVVNVVGVYADDGSVLSHDTLHVTITKSTLPAAEVEIMGMDNNDSNHAWFNIKSEKKNVYAVKYIANYSKEVQKMLDQGYTYEDLLSSYGEYLSEENIAAINSDEGLALSIASLEDMETTLIIGAMNEEEGMTIYTGVSRSAMLPTLPPVYSPLFEDLKGDWTARIVHQVEEYDWETWEYVYRTVTSYTTISLGADFDNSPKNFDASHESYANVYNRFYYKAIENGATEEEAAEYAKAQVAAQFAQYKETAAKYEEKYKGQNYILGIGLEDAHTYASPWDLFCNTDYTAYDTEELFYAYGPKLFFQVQQDGSLCLLGDADIKTLAPVAAWGDNEFVVAGNNPNNENDHYSGAFPVEVIDDNTLVIKGVNKNGQMYYPAIGYWSFGWLDYVYQTIEEIRLTRNTNASRHMETRANNIESNEMTTARVNSNRIKRTHLSTIELPKAADKKCSSVLEKIQERTNMYKEHLSK